MRSGFIAATFLSLFLVSILSGCGSTPKGDTEYKTANNLASVGQYDEAIAYLRQAIAKEPDNQKYKSQLADLQSTYLQSASQKINAILVGDLSQAELDVVESILQGLRESGISESKFAALQSDFLKLSTSFESTLAEHYSKANSYIDQGRWVEAHAELNTIIAMFPNYENVIQKKNLVESQALKTYIKNANDAIKNDEFQQARAAIKALLTVLPSNPIAKNINDKLTRIDRPEYFIEKAGKAFESKNWQLTIDSCNKVRNYPGNSIQCSEIYQSSKKYLTDEISSSINSTIKNKKFNLSFEFYNNLKDMKTLNYNELASIRSKMIGEILASADQYISADNYAVAWHLYTIVEQLEPRYQGLARKLQNTEDEIFERSKRAIAVFDFKSPGAESDSGVIVANNLISRLFNNASSDVRIIERDSLKSIMDEMDVVSVETITESTAKRLGQAHDIDYAIIGSVLLYKVDEDTSTSTKNIRYKVGEKIEDNIDYLNWRAMNPNPTKSELREAPKAKIMVPEYGQKDYEITQTKKVGFIQLSFRIVDIATGENTHVETIERKMQVSDTSNAGVAEAGIQYDEMEVATNTEILQQLTTEIVQNMAAEILKPLQKLETYYLAEAKNKEKRSEYNAAIQQYTYAIFNEKLKSVANSPVTREAQSQLNSLLRTFTFKPAA